MARGASEEQRRANNGGTAGLQQCARSDSKQLHGSCPADGDLPAKKALGSASFLGAAVAAGAIPRY